MLENIYLECIEDIGMGQSSQNSIFTVLSSQNLATLLNNQFKMLKNAQLTHFAKLKMIPQKLDNFHKLFGRYMMFEVTFSHPNNKKTCHQISVYESSNNV